MEKGHRIKEFCMGRGRGGALVFDTRLLSFSIFISFINMKKDSMNVIGADVVNVQSFLFVQNWITLQREHKGKDVAN